MQSEHNIPVKTETLFFLSLSFTMILVMANWFDARLISLFGISTQAGNFVFPFTFLLSDLITEVYGYKNARRAIWYGFIFNLFYLTYGQIVIHLPSPSFATHNVHFDAILNLNARIIVASIISYLCSEPLNSLILSKLKIRDRGHRMARRFLSATFFSAMLDSMMFCTIAFYGIFSTQNILMLMFTTWLFKVCIETLGLPLSLWLAKHLKQKDQMDIFDTGTNYNLFSLDTHYAADKNGYIMSKV